MPPDRDLAGEGLLEESMDDLYEHAPSGYLSTLPGGLVVKANATFLSLTGWPREELIGRKRLQDLLAPGARIYYETHYAPLLTMQGEVREIAVELLRADGGRVPVLLNSSLVRDERGEPQVIRTTVFDATERRRYERELQRLRADAESRARAARALDHVHDGVVLVSEAGVVELLNPSAARILAVDAAEAVGRPLAELVPGWDDVAAPIRVGAPTFVPLAVAGSERWLALSREEAGEGATVWSMRDVTGERALEELRGDLVAVVSHELRTPLTGVYGSAHTLLARFDELTDGVRHQLLHVLVEQADRLAALVDRILLTSQLDAGALASVEGRSEATDIVEAALSALPPSERGRVLVTLASGCVRDGSDFARQVLANLVENALKYSHGPVRLDVAHEDGTIRFTVADEGPGVPPEERERIFEKFHRVDPGQRSGVAGAGLGLYIARRLAESLGGRVVLLSAERGTRIALELPAVDSGA
jgi:PAS domain S-box-containing protein